MEIHLSFGETWTLIGVWAAAIISSSLKWLFYVFSAVMHVLKWIVFGFHRNQGPGELNGPVHRNGRRRLQDLTYYKRVFSATCTAGS